MGKFSTSYELVKLSFKIINKEKELLVYSLLSSICVILVVISFFAFLFGVSLFGGVPAEGTTQTQIFDYIFMFLFYFVLTFVGLFFNTAIITSVNRVIQGKENSFMDGISDSFSNIGKIFIWALISSTVSTILKIIQDRVPFVAKIVVAIVGAVWNIATFFAFPLMILGNRSSMQAIKESPKMFIKGWGETTIVNVGVGLFFGVMIFALTFSTIFMSILFTVMGLPTLGLISGGLFVIGFVLLILLSVTTDSVIKTVLYVYLETEQVPDYVDVNLLGQMFKEKEAKKA